MAQTTPEPQAPPGGTPPGHQPDAPPQVTSSIAVVGPYTEGRNALHKLQRRQLKRVGTALGNMLLAGKHEGDHLRVTHDIPAGEYMFAMNTSPEGYVQLDLVPGRVTAADVAGR